jgi:hypothetical protein
MPLVLLDYSIVPPKLKFKGQVGSLTYIYQEN